MDYADPEAIWLGGIDFVFGLNAACPVAAAYE